MGVSVPGSGESMVPPNTTEADKILGLSSNGLVERTSANTYSSGALSGDVTTSGLVATVAKIAGVTVGTPTGTGNVVMSSNVVATSGNAATVTNGVYTTSQVTALSTTATNDNASSGKVGEVITSTVTVASPTALTTTNTDYDVTSIALTAGHWHIDGNVYFNPSSAVTGVFCWISTTSATLPNAELRNSSSAAQAAVGMSTPSITLKLASSGTAYLSCRAQFSTGTCSGSGTITATRVR